MQVLDNLTIHQANDNDWFKFTTAVGGGLTVRIDGFSNSQGDIDLKVIDPSNQTYASTTQNDWEQVALTGAAGTYYVQVYGYNGATCPHYKLTITPPAVTIQPDRYEPNDTRSAATDLRQLTGAGNRWDNITITSGDNDWFKFATVATGTASDRVHIDFQAASGQLGLELYNGSGQLLSQATGAGNGQSIALTGQAAGTYYAHVFGVSGATNPGYSLVIDCADRHHHHDPPVDRARVHRRRRR